LLNVEKVFKKWITQTINTTRRAHYFYTTLQKQKRGKNTSFTYFTIKHENT